MERRRICIGDIHGGLRSLQQVLYRCKYDPENDDLIFLGDYVDGWSQSAEVVDFIIGLKEKVRFMGLCRDSVVCILGNHDEWCKDFLFGGYVDPSWLSNGGRSTLNSYINFMEGKPQSDLDPHRQFFDSLYDHYITKDNIAFVHAGCDLDGGVTKTLPYLKVWDKNMWAKVLSGATVKAHKELFIGHTTTEMIVCKAHYPEAKFNEVGKPIFTPINRQNVWNLDTGGGWSGKLTAMNIDTKEYWQSDFVYDLYPEEEGRRGKNK